MFIRIVFLMSVLFAVSCGGSNINNSGTGAAGDSSTEVSDSANVTTETDSDTDDNEENTSESTTETVETADNASDETVEDSSVEDNSEENQTAAATSENEPTLKVIQLPDPKAQFAKYNSNSLLYALENRRAGRDFTNVPLELGELSALLWSAYGVNRENGNRTIPTSSNTQDMVIYVVKDDGIWIYNAQENTIAQITTEDVRQTLEPAVARGAAVTLYYVQNMEKASNERAGDRHAGSMYQNVGLFCAIANLNNVVTGSFTRNPNIEQTLQLPDNHRAIIAQSIGKRP